MYTYPYSDRDGFVGDESDLEMNPSRETLINAAVDLLQPPIGKGVSSETLITVGRMLFEAAGIDFVELTGEEKVRYERAQLFKALADPNRIQILEILKSKDGHLNVDGLVTTIDRLAQPTVSHHLRKLRDLGIVTVTTSGLERFYTVKAGKLKEMADYIHTLYVGLPD